MPRRAGSRDEQLIVRAFDVRVIALSTAHPAKFPDFGEVERGFRAVRFINVQEADQLRIAGVLAGLQRSAPALA